jgi:hypothetical protein
MPWCHTCSKYWTPAAMRPDGSCPICGAVLVIGGPVHEHEPGEAPAEAERVPGVAAVAGARDPDDVADSGDALDADDADDSAVEAGDDDSGVPWHFKLLIALLVIYLVYRFVEIGIKIFT